MPVSDALRACSVPLVQAFLQTVKGQPAQRDRASFTRCRLQRLSYQRVLSHQLRLRREQTTPLSRPQDAVAVLQRWAGSDNVSNTDRAAAAKVLDVLAASAASEYSLADTVQTPGPLRPGSSSSGGGGGGSAGPVGQAALSEVAARCEGTTGDWCGKYLTQKPIATKVGDKTCASMLQARPYMTVY